MGKRNRGFNSPIQGFYVEYISSAILFNSMLSLGVVLFWHHSLVMWWFGISIVLFFINIIVCSILAAIFQ